MSTQPHGLVAQLALVEATRRGWRLFKNNIGRAWLGKVTEEYTASGKGGPVKMVLLRAARVIAYGLGVGTSDLIGWETRVITPSMVGERVAVFTAVECKTPAYNTLSAEQRNFLAQVRKAGGNALVARRRGGEVEMEEYAE